MVAGGSLEAAAFERGLVVVVEPLYGGVAVAAALDAGWGSVEIARELPETAPIPLVSFEQAPAGELAAGRCRVRSSDLGSALDEALAHGSTVLLAAPALARPFAAQLSVRLGATDIERVTFVVAPSTHGSADAQAQRFERAAADGWWAAGALIRVLLDELDARDARLTDAAGIAVHLATGTEDASSHLGAGVRWRRHLARGGAADDLRVARALDTLAVVPVVTIEDDAPIARQWAPA
ncbi:MAG: hypothetical protein JWN72_2360 [Thermoleophilia bacterium]|nr:hypothetical protein [Thermoleophilia bacterium]